jgi:hypothetical protein
MWPAYCRRKTSAPGREAAEIFGLLRLTALQALASGAATLSRS